MSNFEILNNQKAKVYNLEERTLGFAKKVFKYVKKLPRTPSNIEVIKQLVRNENLWFNYRENK